MINYTVYLIGRKNDNRVMYKGSKTFEVDPKKAASIKLTVDELAIETAEHIVDIKNLDLDGSEEYTIVRLTREIPLNGKKQK